MRFKFLFIIVLQLTLLSCDNEEINHDELSFPIILNISENFPNKAISNPTLTLKIETEEIFSCYNYQLVTEKSVSNRVLKIEILGTDIGDLCLHAFAPATTSIELNQNIERIILTNNGIVDEYEVSISKSSVTVNSSNTGFSSFDYSIYYRLPENSFAFLCGTLVKDSMICDEFEQHLINNLSLDEFSFQTNGRIPYPDSASGYWHNAPSKYYKYENSDSLEKAGELLQNYYNSELTDKEGLGLSIIGWNNTNFRNNQ